MWFVFSLIAILFWSGSDLFSKMGSAAEDKYSHWKMVIAVGTVMGIHAIVMLLLGTPFEIGDIIAYLPASALYIISMIFGYVGLRYIVLSVSSPICNSSGAVVSIMCWLILKETIAPLQTVGVVLICLGVFVISLLEKRYSDKERASLGLKSDRKYTHSALAIGLPILYCVIDALGTFVDGYILLETDEAGNAISGYIAEESANIAYEFTFLLMALFAAIYVFIIKKQSVSLKAERPKMIAGVCETAGQLAYIYAIGANTMIAAPMISSYCLFSLIWARIILKEKLTKAQYCAIALAVIGIIILGMEGD